MEIIYDNTDQFWDTTLEYWDGNHPKPININAKTSQATVDSPVSLATVIDFANVFTVVWSNTEDNWSEDLQYWGNAPNRPKPIRLATVSTISNISTD
jgi:hypothetical protein